MQEPLLGSTLSEQDGPALGPAKAAPAGRAAAADALAARITLAIYWSLACNLALLAAKGVAFFSSGSMAVLASAVDSLIDLASQAVISLADWSMAREDARYPAGKSRLEPISVLGCAFLMSLGAVGVVQESAAKWVQGVRSGVPPTLELTPLLVSVLALATLMKLVLYFYCVALRGHSGAAEALAEDHLNDVLSNLGAIVTAAVASWDSRLWWADPAGGILISALIVWRWARITKHSVAKVVGVAARTELLDLVTGMAREHHPHTRPGFLRAYHVGQRVAVDCELEGPPDMTVLEAAAISQSLKEKFEGLPEVEEASVVMVPRGAHTSAIHPALLLPDPVSKPPGTADVPELEGPASVLASAVRAVSPGWQIAAGGAWEEEGAPAGPSTSGDVEKGIEPPDAAGAGGSSSGQHLPPPYLRQLSAPAAILRRTAGSSGDRPSSPAAVGSPHGSMHPECASYAEHVAWMRSLRDGPGRGLMSASFRGRDGLEGAAASAAAEHAQEQQWEDEQGLELEEQAAQHRGQQGRPGFEQGDEEDAGQGSTDSSDSG